MGAFASDDEGFFLVSNGHFQVHEHVAQFLLAGHSHRAHPVPLTPLADDEWKLQIHDQGSLGLTRVIRNDAVHGESHPAQ